MTKAKIKIAMGLLGVLLVALVVLVVRNRSADALLEVKYHNIVQRSTHTVVYYSNGRVDWVDEWENGMSRYTTALPPKEIEDCLASLQARGFFAIDAELQNAATKKSSRMFNTHPVDMSIKASWAGMTNTLVLTDDMRHDPAGLGLSRSNLYRLISIEDAVDHLAKKVQMWR